MMKFQAVHRVQDPDTTLRVSKISLGIEPCQCGTGCGKADVVLLLGGNGELPKPVALMLAPDEADCIAAMIQQLAARGRGERAN